MKRHLYILGAGGHGVVVAELASLAGYGIAGIVDDDPSLIGEKALDWTVVGGRDRIPSGAAVALGVGDQAARAELLSLARIMRWEPATLIHPSAVVSPSAELGAGTVVMAQVVVNARTRIGEGCILNTACSVDHDCLIGRCAHIAPGTRLAGGVSVGERALVGIGSCVRPGVAIGDRCVIGAGSVVVCDIPPGVTAFGHPARRAD